MIWLVFKRARCCMDEYMMGRTERRIDGLERELREIKSEGG
jgi:hypothetical protein